MLEKYGIRFNIGKIDYMGWRSQIEGSVEKNIMIHWRLRVSKKSTRRLLKRWIDDVKKVTVNEWKGGIILLSTEHIDFKRGLYHCLFIGMDWKQKERRKCSSTSVLSSTQMVTLPPMFAHVSATHVKFKVLTRFWYSVHPRSSFEYLKPSVIYLSVF